MKIFAPRKAELWINGKRYVVEEGEQEVEESIAEVLLHAKLAKKIEVKEEKKTKVRSRE